MPDGMIPKSVGLISHIYSGKEPRENIRNGRPIQENLGGFKVDQLDFLLPVEPVRNSFRFGVLVRG